MTRTRSQNGRRSRAKGAAWEREAASILRAIYPGAERNIAQTRSARREGCDIKGTPWWVECKVGANINLKQAYGQALSDGGDKVLVVAKQDRREPVVYVGLEHLVAELGGTYPERDGLMVEVPLPLYAFVELIADAQRHRIASFAALSTFMDPAP